MNAASKRDKTSSLRPDSEGHHLQQTFPNVLIKEAVPTLIPNSYLSEHRHASFPLRWGAALAIPPPPLTDF